MEKRYIIFKFIFNYLVLILIFKNIHYLISINFNDLNNFILVYIPICYLVIKYTFINILNKYNLNKSEYIKIVIISYTIINLIFRMPIFYTLFIILFIIILKDKSYINNETQKRIDDYFKNKSNKN